MVIDVRIALAVAGVLAAAILSRRGSGAGVLRRHRRDAARQLRAMSDLELRDLGIGRCEIGQAVRAPDRPLGRQR